ncbi:9025_t:CDS:2, partial [Acaulospora colombiana]
MLSENVSASSTRPTSVVSTRTSRSPKETMMAVEWHGSTDIKVTHKRKRPSIIKQTDAIIRVTATTICGSDLHLYHKEFPGMQKGDVIGHEAIGIVHEVGCQAEYVRVPFADVNLLRLSSEDYKLLGRKSLLLSDVACTGWHANELGGIKQGDVVGIWGAGPVGLMTAALALYRRASRVYVIDCIQARLAFARDIGAEVINFKEKDVIGSVKKVAPGGFDVTVDAVGFRYTNKSWRHKLEKALFAETDCIDALDEAIKCTKKGEKNRYSCYHSTILSELTSLDFSKGGVVSIVGDYVNLANHFPIGASMEKHLTLRGGQVHPQKYWSELLPIIKAGEIFDKFFTHNMDLSDASRAYKKFDRKEDGVIKVFLVVDKKEFVGGHVRDESIEEIASTSTFTAVVAGVKHIDIAESETGEVTQKPVPNSSTVGGESVSKKKMNEEGDSKVTDGNGNEDEKNEGATDFSRDTKIAGSKTSVSNAKASASRGENIT